MSTKKIITYDDLDTTKFKVTEQNKLTVNVDSSSSNSSINSSVQFPSEFDESENYALTHSSGMESLPLFIKTANGDFISAPVFGYNETFKMFHYIDEEYYEHNQLDPIFWYGKNSWDQDSPNYVKPDENNPDHFVKLRFKNVNKFTDALNTYSKVTGMFPIYHCCATKHSKEYVNVFGSYPDEYEFDLYNTDELKNPFYWLLNHEPDLMLKIMDQGRIGYNFYSRFSSSALNPINPIVRSQNGFVFDINNFAMLISPYIYGGNRTPVGTAITEEGSVEYRNLSCSLANAVLASVGGYKSEVNDSWIGFATAFGKVFERLALDFKFNTEDYNGDLKKVQDNLAQHKGCYLPLNKELLKIVDPNMYRYAYGDHDEYPDGKFIEKPTLLKSQQHKLNGDWLRLFPEGVADVRTNLVKSFLYMIDRELEVNASEILPIIKKINSRIDIKPSIDREEFIRLFNEVLDYRPEPVMEPSPEAWQEFADKQKPTVELFEKLKQRLEHNIVIGG